MVNVIQYGKIETSLWRFILAAVVALAVGRAAANDVTWVGAATGGVWSESSNWQDATTSENHVPTADDIAVFTSATTDVTLDAAASAKGVKFVAAFTLNGTETLTLGASGLNASGAAATVTVNVPIELSSGNISFTTSSSATSSKTYYLDVKGVVSGAGKIVQTGKGRLRLYGANTFTGGLSCDSGGSFNNWSVEVHNARALGGPNENDVFGTVTLTRASGSSNSGLKIMGNYVI